MFSIQRKFIQKQVLFCTLITNFLRDQERNFLENIGNKLGVSKLEDWYRFTAKELITHGGLVKLITFNISYH